MHIYLTATYMTLNCKFHVYISTKSLKNYIIYIVHMCTHLKLCDSVPGAP